MASLIRMGAPTFIVSTVVFGLLLNANVNVLISVVLAFTALVITASIVTRIDFGHWNPF